jgi:hypothetical protein
MPLTGSEFKILRDDLHAAHELVDNGFNTALAAGASTIARHLRHIRSKIEETLTDLDTLQAMQAAIKKRPPSNGCCDE